MHDLIPEDDNRPSPDALLERAQQETRGRFKIFLGAAPGVGKTYEMLQSGRAKRRAGVDVVIGVVETHGRAETRALVRGFEVIDRKEITYRGQRLEEMDLDAILARRPALVLVDELAHTNAPGSRHPKRYLDVMELLEAGIDVYSTLNIQHVESLNDVVAQITRIRVRETVPDSVLDRADDIEIIDITPDDLIKRLHEGKVYLPKTASRAIQNYFQPGNLTALRELALRRTAQRVDQQLLNHMQATGVRGPWPSGDRVLVCVDDSAHATALVRYAKRQADRMRAPWAAIHIELPGETTFSDGQKDRISASLRLAEHLGGETAVLPGQAVAHEVMRYANANNYSHIITGRRVRPRWKEWIWPSVSAELIRSAGAISVHVISATAQDTPASPQRDETRRPVTWTPYGLALLYTALSFGLGKVLATLLNVQNVALVFLMAVLTTAATAGLWPALFASVIGALCFNFFFLDPLHTLTLSNAEGVLTLISFFVAALITSNLTARIQRQARAAQARARMNESLFLFSKRLAVAGTLDDVLWVGVNHIATVLGVNTVILLPEGTSMTVRAGFPPDDTLADSDIAAAHWAWVQNRPAGRGADTLPGARRLYIPLRTGRMTVGVLGLDSEKSGPLLTPEQGRVLDTLADLTALAIERIQLVDDLDRAHLAAEADKLRSALLTSISHDLRTPLAGIMGAASTLRDYFTDLSAPDREVLLTTIEDESDRLSRFIANLLDMSRVQTGLSAANLALVDLGEVLGAALHRAQKILSRHQPMLHVASDLPMLRLDPVLMEQVVFNLLDNAAKYAPDGSRVEVAAWQEGDWVVLRVRDQGPGIPDADLERVFDMFYRARKEDSVQAGTGLGLAICRGFVEAMGGTIRAGNRHDPHGAIFTIRLPVPQPEALPPAEGRT